MRILLVKLSSMGDLIHCLPAVSDLCERYPAAKVDWVVEEAFQAIPKRHPGVNRVISVALRRWRKQPYAAMRDKVLAQILATLKETAYDYIIDAQGLLKSAILARFAKGQIHGFSWGTAREPMASLFYHRHHVIPKGQHAIYRLRQLFASIFGYTASLTTLPLSFQLGSRETLHAQDRQVLFLTGTTWQTKLWPVSHWVQLGRYFNHRGYTVQLLYGNAVEEARARAIAKQLDWVYIWPQLPLAQLIDQMARMPLVVGLDSGLSHVSAALGLPTVVLFGATSLEKTAPLGKAVVLIKSDMPCSPCLKRTCRFNTDKRQGALCMETLSAHTVLTHCLPYLHPVQQEETVNL